MLRAAAGVGDEVALAELSPHLLQRDHAIARQDAVLVGELGAGEVFDIVDVKEKEFARLEVRKHFHGLAGEVKVEGVDD
jgi:hypothetical protein